MSRPPLPLDLADPAHLMRRFVHFCWRLAMGMSPVEAGRFGRLTARCRRIFLADPGVGPLLDELRAGEEHAPLTARPRLLDLARRMFEATRSSHPVATARFAALCAARGRAPEATVVAAVERMATRPFHLPGTRPRPIPAEPARPARPATPATPDALLYRRLLRFFRLHLAERYVRAVIPLFLTRITPGILTCDAETRPFFGLPPEAAPRPADSS
jgi:hypothetical protein